MHLLVVSVAVEEIWVAGSVTAEVPSEIVNVETGQVARLSLCYLVIVSEVTVNVHDRPYY